MNKQMKIYAGLGPFLQCLAFELGGRVQIFHKGIVREVKSEIANGGEVCFVFVVTM